MPKMLHFEPFHRDRGGPGYMTAQTTRRRGDAVKPRPPSHPQTAAFRAIPPRQGRSRLHHGANSLKQGWFQLHHSASDLTQGRRGETQTTPACPKCRISSHSAEAGAVPVTSRGKQPQGGVGPVKPRPPPHAAPAPPVKPRPPPHAQNAAFRAILPRQGRVRLHDGASNPTQGRSRLHHGANSFKQGRP